MTVTILRSRDSLVKDSVTSEIQSSLADRPGIRFLILGRNPTDARIGIWPGLALIASAAALAGATCWLHFEPERFVIGSVPSLILAATLALTLISALIFPFLGVSTAMENKNRCRPDKGRSAYAVEHGWIHLVEVEADRIQRTSIRLVGRQVTGRASGPGEMRYDIVSEDRHFAFEGVPYDCDFNAMIRANESVRVTTQPRIMTDPVGNDEACRGEKTALA